MSFPAGSGRERIVRPTQFHGVSYDERALDQSGNRLPWALEFPEGHQNARNLRKTTEEKGAFGRSRQRKTGSVRGTTRTQTPAKKEAYPGLDGFEAALKFDATHRQSTQQQQQSQGAQSGFSNDAAHSMPSARDAVPTEVLLYGFAPETQWAAISFYENASGGMICEDYERNPPEERRRYQGGLGMSGNPGRARRTLSKREMQLAMQYRGGNCWIKVTFDSKEAAERAIAAGPHLLQSNWVHAAPWKGQAPEADEPIPMEDEDRQGGGLASPRPRRDVASHFRRPSGVPQSPDLRGTPRRSSSNAEVAVDDSPMSTTTASSATATAPETGMRQRGTGMDPALTGSMRLFQDQRRTIVRPATEALLPVPTFTERFWAWLTSSGLVPGEVIGSTVPRLETGEFDWNAASYYWQFVKWLDDILGTDMCGLKAD